MKKVVVKEKLYVIRKYIKARSAQHAISKDHATPVDDCWVDEEFKKNMLADAVGFQHI